MDTTSQMRLRLRHEKLSQLVQEIQEKNEISEEDLIVTRLKLKHAIAAFEKELHTNSGLDIAESTILMKELLEAEELEINLNSTAEIFQRSRTKISSKLPKLDLIKFNGDILQWSGFWDRFEANVDCKELRDVEKLAYLLGSLEDKALETVSGLAITNGNYSIAIEILRKRFGSTDRVIDAHYTAISNIKLSSNKPSSCRFTLDTVEKHLRVLKTLGESVESNHLRTIIGSKFPEQILYQVNLLSTNDQSVPTLRSNLDKVITALERSDIDIESNTSDSLLPTTTAEALQIRTEQNTPRQVSKRKNYDFKTYKEHQAKKFKYKCLFCDSDSHVSSYCKQVRTAKDRRAKLNGKCFKCFKDHMAKDCTRNITCFNCKGDHVKMLCPKPIDRSSNFNGFKEK